MKKLLFIALLLACLPVAHADLNITVTGGQVAPQPIAVVPFKAPAGAKVDVAKIIQSDLASSGLFKPIARKDMLETPSQPNDVNFRNWQVLGANNIVIGSQQRVGKNVKVRFYLLDVFQQRQLLGFDMPATPPDRLRYVAHRIADLVYKKLTGVHGYFDTQIVYVEAKGLGDARHFKLVVCDSDGRFPRVIASSGEPLMSPAWSPDRKKIAFVGYHHGRSAIYVDTLATGALRRVTDAPGVNGSPAWAPDGQTLAVTLSNGDNADVYKINLSNGHKQRLTTNPAIDTEPAFSPDGSTIAFTSDRGGNPQIYTMPADGSGTPQRITFQGKQNLRPRYSPDGRFLAMVDLQDGLYRIALKNLETGERRILTDGPVDEGLSFAPNSRVLIYEKRTSKGTELATVSTQGGIKRVLSSSNDVQDPAWSPYIQ